MAGDQKSRKLSFVGPLILNKGAKQFIEGKKSLFSTGESQTTNIGILKIKVRSLPNIIY